MELADAPIIDLLDSAPDAMVVVDESGDIQLANKQTEALFGYARQELLGQPVEMLLPLRFRNAHPQHRRRFFAEPALRPMGAGLELFGMRKNGSEFPVEISLSPLASAAGTLISGAIRDVSERKAMEAKLIQARREAERANAAKSEFLAAASHNLRQPLQSLALLTGVLDRAIHDTNAREALAAQREALRAMTDLLNTLLDISKLESGAITADISDCSVQAIFKRLHTNFAAQAMDKGIHLQVDDCDDTVRTDPGLLEQLLQNLVANAIRYTKAGRVILRCRRLLSAVRIEIADTGVGIAQHQVNYIFDDFYQIDDATALRRDGFGLGLAIVQRLSRLLGHRVEVDSVPGKGSCFAITLPSGEQRAQPPPQPATVDQPESLPAPATVLIIEDDAAVADATKLLLELEGFRILSAPTLDGALKAVNAAPATPDFIISDLHLSGSVTGIDAIKEIREALQCEIPAMLVTGDTSSQTSDALQDLSACTVLSKPVNTEALLSRIKQLITQSNQSSSLASGDAPAVCD